MNQNKLIKQNQSNQKMRKKKKLNKNRNKIKTLKETHQIKKK